MGRLISIFRGLGIHRSEASCSLADSGPKSFRALGYGALKPPPTAANRTNPWDVWIPIFRGNCVDFDAVISEAFVRLLAFHNSFNRNIKFSFGALSFMAEPRADTEGSHAFDLPTGTEPWDRPRTGAASIRP